MNLKKTFMILCVLLILLSTITVVSAENSYTIGESDIEMYVTDDGMLHVSESYLYNFEGTFNGVYRDIPLKEGESLSNVKVSARGAYPVLEHTHKDGKEHLKIYLYSDEAHKHKISDCSVIVIIEYDMKNVVTVFNDVAAVQYKLWGEEWDVGVGKVYALVGLPNQTGNEYFLNPEEFTNSSEMDGNEIEINSNYIPKGKFYELLVLMPVEDFSSAPYAKHVNEDGREMILKNLEDSKNSRSFWATVTSILEGLLCIGFPFSFIVTYLKYGREPKVEYDGIYEREPPTHDKPAVVNAMIDNTVFGTPNMKGFEATIMDLIDRKVLNIEKDNVNLLLTVDEGADELDNGERIVVNILSHFSKDGVVNLSKLEDRMKSKSNAEWFLDKYEDWKKAVEDEYLPDDVKSRYFDDMGTTLASVIGFLGAGIGLLFFFIFVFFDFEGDMLFLAIGIVLGLFSLLMLGMRDDIFGRWTKEGRVIYLKWINFKKFLDDNSLINEHPPQSIAVWKKYLIYATSLGVAKSVEKAMNLHVPNVQEYDDGVFLYQYYGYHCFSNAYNNANDTTSSSSGSYGSIGGGSGGGGGGAF